MKNTLFLLSAVVVILMNTQTAVEGQSYRPTRIFKHGQADFRIGVGVLPTYAKANARTAVLPVSACLDWMLSNQLSLGFSAGYSRYGMSKVSAGKEFIRDYTNQTFQFAGRFAAHFTRTDNLDIYGGIELGAEHIRIQSESGPFGDFEHLYGIRPQRSHLRYGACLGLRYAVTPKTTIFGEVGTGIALAQVGVGKRLR